ncbi:hypothetical protein DASC09_041470 [Saccharomycopsis crataegensis]|uniref:Uncharacterized protein n=1 Tax=Saccharomycopsis crataegensis TaxID=43959 RepID=A0AAV5QPQ0_9ASCO|nr:hypothetical protein DASC09_041470 [Saccharomycopsis crataegensis]
MTYLPEGYQKSDMDTVKKLPFELFNVKFKEGTFSFYSLNNLKNLTLWMPLRSEFAQLEYLTKLQSLDILNNVQFNKMRNFQT